MINWDSVEKIKTPEDIEKENESRLAKEYLSGTDWYVMRFVETGVEVPNDVTEKRNNARLKIIA